MASTILIGAPIDEGQRRAGCVMGPAAYRVAGIAAAIRELGHTVDDWGDLALPELAPATCPNPAVHSLPEILGWTQMLSRQGRRRAQPDGALPIILGGDHSLALGSVTGAVNFARRQARPLFLLWLDAHSDFHTPMTTTSGNLHGTPVAYITGRSGFRRLSALSRADPGRTASACIGIRSVDPAEHAALLRARHPINDMRVIDEHGIVAPLREFLDTVAPAKACCMSRSTSISSTRPSRPPSAPPSPAAPPSARRIWSWRLLHDSGLVTSLDLVELNPFLDDRGRTAKLMVDSRRPA